MSAVSSLKKRLYLTVVRYFRFWANISLRRWNPRIIAVTGSVGKTTMLHLLEQQLGDKAHYSHNANSAYGISFDIVGLRGITNTKWRWLWLLVAAPVRSFTFRYKQPFYVVEIDGERPGEASLLAQWLVPEVTLWVSSENSHAVYFDKLVKSGQFSTVEDAIAHEFASLAHNAKKLVIIDGDNPLMTQNTEAITARVEAVRMSDLQGYEVWPNKTIFTLPASVFEFTAPLPREVSLQLQMLERLFMYLELPVDYSNHAFVQPAGRSRYFEGVNDTKLIDSSYNAHLSSMLSILKMFEVMQAEKKWVVLGDMIEQGQGEADQHTKLAKYLESTKFDRYILIGKRMQTYVAPLLADKKETVSFAQTTEALDYIQKELAGGETILLKGSQYLEWIVERLLAHPEDKKLLPRQEPAAIKRRKAWGLT